MPKPEAVQRALDAMEVRVGPTSQRRVRVYDRTTGAPSMLTPAEARDAVMAPDATVMLAPPKVVPMPARPAPSKSASKTATKTATKAARRRAR